MRVAYAWKVQAGTRNVESPRADSSPRSPPPSEHALSTRLSSSPGLSALPGQPGRSTLPALPVQTLIQVLL